MDLNNSIKFDKHSTVDHPEVEKVIRKTMSSKRKNKKQAYAHRHIIINLYFAWLIGACVGISSDKHHYTTDKRYQVLGFSHKPMMKAKKDLIDNEYMEHSGFIVPTNDKEGKTSRYWAAPKLIKLFENNKLEPECMPLHEPIILRDQNKKCIGYKDNQQTRRWRLDLLKINNVLADTKIGIDDVEWQLGITELQKKEEKRREKKRGSSYTNTLKRIDELIRSVNLTFSKAKSHKNIVRIFSNPTSFSSQEYYGGRYYCLLQNLPSVLRKSVTFDGQYSTELDYSGLHLNICSHLSGHQLDVVDPYDFGFGSDDMRTFFKYLCIIAINCKSRSQAISAIQEKFYLKDHGLFDYQSILDSHNLTISSAYDIFVSRYSFLVDWISSGRGTELQYIDSKIATIVLNTFAAMGIPIIPVHDSFIVPEKYKDQLRSVMQMAYADVVGYPSPRIK